jgi:hypothetical protein
MKEKPKQLNIDRVSFQIIRHYGTPTKAQLPDGTWVYGQDKFFVPEYGGFIPAAPYDDHFLYEMPKHYKYAPSFACSCGGVGIIVGQSGYLLDASPQGKMMVCMVHATFGKHATGGERWV